MSALLTATVDVRRADQRLASSLPWLDSKHSQLREQLEPLRNPALFAACAELNPEHGVVHQALQLLTVRIRHLSEQITALKKQITLTIRALNSDLLKVFGVGPDSAAALLIAAGENHNRLTSEASFAALCGASPVAEPVKAIKAGRSF
ncbi:hypothetical protein OG819_35825 [Streptomyces sp. NBC_01549]|uniref:transposase n=1 Tax=Streptomyces sp. NBC_01549 TaxID=2975874 RepID=UPI0022572011|nr:transposase [Streptomyces sp. NBC_01549]MCX4594869.1 hypothetical protein [Streptomyces sp. NBC_01549]